MKQPMPYRLPAEWEQQDAVLLAWPHEKTDWAPILSAVESVYLELVRRLVNYEPVVIVTPEPAAVRERLEAHHIAPGASTIIAAATHDTWIRDYGPLTVYRPDRQPVLLDFTFNGWGGKFAADTDNAVTAKLSASGALEPVQRCGIDLVLEGGSIEVDGRGTLLTTSRCLLNPQRNPHLQQAELEKILAGYFGIDHFLWLDHGELRGDDTDAHIDTLARLCPDDVILYVRCPDQHDEHYAELKRMEEQLRKLTTRKGDKFRCLPLPWPRACYAQQRRLPATYANFLVVNGAVFVPTYNNDTDAQALSTVAAAFPAHDIIGIDCLPLIRQHGSLHCITMQLPAGVLR